MRNSHVSAGEFAALFESLCNWGQWGADDERGALNLLTADRVASSARLVLEGRTVTLSLPLNTEPAPHNPVPADHHMPLFGEREPPPDPVHFLKDYVGADYHNDGHTHIDALCHVAYNGLMYNGRPEDTVGEQGATVNTIEVLRDGLVGRAVLLDIPRVRGVSWLEPGEHVFAQDLEAAERAQGVQVRTGDILLVRTGLPPRLARLGSWDTPVAKAGLHPDGDAIHVRARGGGARLRREQRHGAEQHRGRRVSDPRARDLRDGLHLLDYLQFEDLREMCERNGRWEFLFAAAPLRIVNGTGSPFNPVAVFSCQRPTPARRLRAPRRGRRPGRRPSR